MKPGRRCGQFTAPHPPPQPSVFLSVEPETLVGGRGGRAGDGGDAPVPLPEPPRPQALGLTRRLPVLRATGVPSCPRAARRRIPDQAPPLRA